MRFFPIRGGSLSILLGFAAAALAGEAKKPAVRPNNTGPAPKAAARPQAATQRPPQRPGPGAPRADAAARNPGRPKPQSKPSTSAPPVTRTPVVRTPPASPPRRDKSNEWRDKSHEWRDRSNEWVDRPRYVAPGYNRNRYYPGVNRWGYDPYTGLSPYGPYNGYGNAYGNGYGYGYGYEPYVYSSGYANGYGPETPYAPLVPYYGFYSPVIFAPAGALYGPGPIAQLMGVDHWFSPKSAAGAAGRGEGAANPVAVRDAKPADRPPPVRLNRDDAPARGTSPRALELGWTFIERGDTQFGNQRYADALDRYKQSGRTAPQLGAAWFRQGFAQAALGRYDAAAKAFRRGLEIEPEWPTSTFRLDDLFKADMATKKARLDSMIEDAAARPHDGDLAFVLATHLHFDGQTEQAQAMWKRAGELGGNDAEVKAFADQ